MVSRNVKQGDRILELLRKEFPEYHPMIGIARIAHTADDPRLEFDCHKTLAEYIEPKLKSVEVSQAPADANELRVVFEGDVEDAEYTEHSREPEQLEHDEPEAKSVDEVLQLIPRREIG